MVCLAFIFYHMVTFIRYVEANFTFGLVDCVRYNEDFVKSRFCSIHFTVILAGLKKIVRYTENFVIQRFVKSRFHCIGVKGIVLVLNSLACVAGSFAGEGKGRRAGTSSEAATTMRVLAAPPPVRAHFREFALICGLAKNNSQQRRLSSVFQVSPLSAHLAPFWMIICYPLANLDHYC